MNIRTPFILTALLGLACLAPCAPAFDGPASTVTVSANGTDVATVLHDLFTQTKQNFVIEPGVHYSLNLSLDKVDFDEALGIICHLAKIKAEKQNGIYYVTQDPAAVVPVKTQTTPKEDPPAAPVLPPVTATTLKTKRVTTRLAKADIRKVFAAISKETNIPISVDASVPNFRLDAFLEKTSLKYALDEITSATKLSYKIVNKTSILIFVEENENRIAVVSGP